MADTTMTLRIDPLTLANVCDGQVEVAFQNAIADVAAAFHDRDDVPWELTRGQATCKVDLNVAFTFDYDTGTLFVRSTSKVSLPKRRGAVSPAMLRDGAIFCEPSGSQLTMFSSGKTEPAGGTND